MELRNLKSKDLFLMFQIINKIGIRKLKEVMSPEAVTEIMAAVADDGNAENITERVGLSLVIDIAGILFEGLPRCQNELFSLMAELSGKTVKEIEELPPADLMDAIVELVNKQEFPDFFKAASKLFK